MRGSMLLTITMGLSDIIIRRMGIPKMWMRCFPDSFARNLSKPNNGFGGFLVKHILEERSVRFQKIIVELCNIQSDNVVLEIGFGPGLGIKQACECVKDGRGTIYGLDASERMVRTASRRLHTELADGKAVLALGCVTNMPFQDAMFDRVFHCHSFNYWGDLDSAVSEIHRVLKEGGVVITALKPDSIDNATRMGYLKYGDPDHKRYVEALIKHGFRQVECVDRVHASGVSFKIISGER